MKNPAFADKSLLGTLHQARACDVLRGAARERRASRADRAARSSRPQACPQPAIHCNGASRRSTDWFYRQRLKRRARRTSRKRRTSSTSKPRMRELDAAARSY